MTVDIDPSSGFCWGVVRTIEIAEDELQQGNEIYSLGDIIHNPEEIARLEKLGLKTIGVEDLPAMSGKKVLIRAHGEPPTTYRIAAEAGVELIDATCPVVTKLQERIRKYYDEGYQIVIFGKKDHAEVKGLRGVCYDSCIVAKSIHEIEDAVDYRRPTVLFSQTTMDKPAFNEMKEYLRARIAELIVDTSEEIATEFHAAQAHAIAMPMQAQATPFQAKDTICGQVSGRDKKLRAFAALHDTMIFVAGKNSSNGKVLFHICCDANPHSHFIESPGELQPEWFDGIERVGITGATSTPLWLMQRVREEILAKNGNTIPV